MANNRDYTGDAAAKRTHFGLSDSTTQSIAIINTPQSIAFNTHDITLVNCTHSTTVNNDEITIDNDGVLRVALQPQIDNTSGNNTLTAWVDIDTGSGFIEVANTAAFVRMGANTDTVLPIVVNVEVNDGDKVRFRMQGDSTNLSLSIVASATPVPAVPSCILVGTI